MVDVAAPPGLDGATLGPNRDPQGHLRSPVAQLKASLWVPCRIDSAAESLKYKKKIDILHLLVDTIVNKRKAKEC